jgi:hypothetical protein
MGQLVGSFGKRKPSRKIAYIVSLWRFSFVSKLRHFVFDSYAILLHLLLWGGVGLSFLICFKRSPMHNGICDWSMSTLGSGYVDCSVITQSRPWQESTLRCGLILSYHSTADRDRNWRGRDGNSLRWQKGKSYTLLNFILFMQIKLHSVYIDEHLLVNHIRWMHPVFILLTEKSLLLSSCNISWFEHKPSFEEAIKIILYFVG